MRLGKFSRISGHSTNIDEEPEPDPGPESITVNVTNSQSLEISVLNVLLVDRVLVGETLRDHTFQIVIIHIDLKDEFLLITGRDLVEVGTHQLIVEIIR